MPFNNEKDKAFQEIIDYYHTQSLKAASSSGISQELVVEMLREIQELYGYIDSEKQALAAEAAGTTSVLLSKLIKLYPSLKARPAAHRIVVCTGRSCGTCRAAELLESVRKAVEKRPPGTFEVVTRNCLKSCRTSPNLTVDGQLFPLVNREDIDTILDKFGSFS